jgi:hypothetical protein
MLIEKGGATIHTNVENQVKFGIQNSGKMFKMIISGLYSKKAESITREIWSNAFDAHCMAGCPDTPFEVTLPSSWRPEFKVRDFGDGLSHEWMEDNYTVLGHSSKENTNIAVGKWGVGRMSPLSYTDTFSVTSIHKGKKTVYSVTMEGTGEPTLNVLIPPMETDEKSGLTITFPVSSKDFSSFETAAKRVALGLSVKPSVVGKPNYEWPELELTTQGNGYSVYTHNGSNYGERLSGPLAKMGCVIYPINTSEIKNLPYHMRNFNVLIDVPIGSVEVTASREDLSYGPKDPTTEYLTKRLKEIQQDLVKDAQASVDKCDNIYEAYWLLRNSGLDGSLRGSITYKGKEKLNQGFEVPEDVVCFQKQYRGLIKSVSSGDSTKKWGAIYVAYRKGPKHDVRAESRVRATSGQVSLYNVVGLVYADWDKDKKEYDTSAVDEAKRVFGAKLVSNLSDLPDVTPVTRKKVKASVKDLGWNDTEVDMEDGGYYLKSRNNNLEDVNYRFTPSMITLTQCLKGETVVIVPATLHKKFDDHDKWKPAYPVFKDWVTKEQKELAATANCSNVSDAFDLRDYSHLFKGNLKRYYDKFSVVRREYKGISSRSCSTLLVAGGLPYDSYYDSKLAKELEALKEKIQKEYPLIRKSSGQAQAHMAEYVVALDQYRNKS